MVSKGQSLLPNACSLILRVIRVQCGWTSQFSKDGGQQQYYFFQRKVGVLKRTYFAHIPSPLIIFKKSQNELVGANVVRSTTCL